MLSNLRALVNELRRRKVFRVAAVYAAVAFVVAQVASLTFPALQLPGWAYPLVVVLGLLGFPIALVLAWSFETTPDAAVELAGAAVSAAPLEEPGTAPPSTSPSPGRRDHDDTLDLPEGPSIAVLPFRDLSGDEGEQLFATAMTNDIAAGLTRSSSLFVVSTGETEPLSVPGADAAGDVGKRLGVRYVLQGTVNRVSEQLRVTARLTDVHRSVQIWSGTYDRELSSATALFDVQDEIREQIVSTLSDLHGVIYSEETRRNLHRPTANLSAYECLSVALAYDKYLSEDHHLRARESLERAVELDPGFASAWAHLSWIYTDEFAFGFNPLPDAMDRALGAARRAIKLAPADYHGRWLLSRVYYFGGERDLFVAEAEKSLDLNASDGTTIGLIGGYLVCSGQVDRGRALVQKARVLNPGHPDYYYTFLGIGKLLEGDEIGALRQLRKGPLEFPVHLVLVSATAAMAGRPEEGVRTWKRLVGLQPGMTVGDAETIVARFLPYQPELLERIAASLRLLPTGG